MCPESDSARQILLLTCEHGGNDVPEAYADMFHGQHELLASHRGYDVGALGVAQRMAPLVSAPIIYSTTTRLLVDLNRSPDQPDAFSELSRDLPQAQKNTIMDVFYTPHRESVANIVRTAARAGGRVIHIGIHSCTDVLGGKRRELDIALLFDPARSLELDFCKRWQASLLSDSPTLRCPFNEPYKGTDDGLTTTLRSRFTPATYLGIEVEIRQGLVGTEGEQSTIGTLLARSLKTVLAQGQQ